MLTNITFTFPNNTKTAQNFFDVMTEILSQLPNARLADSSLELRASQPMHSLPVTTFRQADITFPQLHLDAEIEGLAVGNLHINHTISDDNPISGKPFGVVEKHDALGTYYELQPTSLELYHLPLDELHARLKGHIVRIDHTGVNIPAALVSRQEWQHFIGQIAQSANIYNYPTGEEWPFILPATAKEHEHEITSFPGGREPKFELVYDSFSPVPSIQIDIETDLERPEIERLFPEPYGVSFPELANFFRTVYVHHEWPGLNIRFDIRFKNNEPDGAWETGKWLVQDGGRIES